MKNYGFALSSERTLSRWLEVVNLGAGICPHLTHLIETKVNCMSDMEKKCIILLDEMSIKTSLEFNSKKDLVEGYFCPLRCT